MQKTPQRWQLFLSKLYLCKGKLLSTIRLNIIVIILVLLFLLFGIGGASATERVSSFAWKIQDFQGPADRMRRTRGVSWPTVTNSEGSADRRRQTPRGELTSGGALLAAMQSFAKFEGITWTATKTNSNTIKCIISGHNPMITTINWNTRGWLYENYRTSLEKR